MILPLEAAMRWRAGWSGLPPNLRGAIFMLGSGLVFTAMMVIIRHVSDRIHPLQMAFFRCAIGWLAIMPFVAHVGIEAMRSMVLGKHLSRAALGTIAMFCAYYAIAHMPLTDYTALSFTRPLFATVFAVVILREIVRWRRWTATIVGFLGVVVMVRPGAGTIDPATFVALGESVSLALLIVIVKLMPPTEKTITMLFCFGAFSAPITLLPAIYVWVWPTVAEWFWLIAMALAGVAAQWLFLLAFRSGEASFVAPIDYARLIFVSIVGYAAFAEIPSLWTLAGAAIIIASTLYIVRREAKLGRRAIASEPPRAP
jgi:drug/metabolite transporter (DMT)-like permease